MTLVPGCPSRPSERYHAALRRTIWGTEAKSFDVVDGRGQVFKTVRHREGRAIARVRVFAFEAVEQGTFLAADIRTSTAADVEFTGEVAAENVFADQVGGAGLGQGVGEDGVDFRVFVAQIEKGAGSAGGVRGEEHAFDDRVWVPFEEGAVLKAARLALVGIADDGFRRAWGLGNGLPLLTSGKARSAPTGELAVGNEGHQFGWFPGEGLLQGLVSAGLAIAGQGGAARRADVGKDAFLVPAGIGHGQGRRTGCKGLPRRFRPALDRL